MGINQHNPTDFSSHFTYSAGSTSVTFTSILGGDTVACVMWVPASNARLIEFKQVDICAVTNLNAGATTVRLVGILGSSAPAGGSLLTPAKALSTDPAPNLLVRTTPTGVNLDTGMFGAQGFLLGVLGAKTTSDNLINQPLYSADNNRHRRPITLIPGALQGVAFVVNTAVISLQRWTVHVDWAETLP